MKKKRLIAWLMALALILTSSMYIVYAEEEASGAESSQDEDREEKEDKEEKENKEDREDREDKEDEEDHSDESESSSDHDEQQETPASEDQELPGATEPQSEPQSEITTDDGQSTQEQDSPSSENDESSQVFDGESDLPEMEEMQDETQAEEISSYEPENAELPVIIKYVETDEYPEGTVLREYQDVDEYGNPVIIRELATAPVEGIVQEEDFNLLDHYGLVASNTEVPNFDNGGWPGIPASYEYNWDNTANATGSGMWGGNGKLQGYVAATIEDINVRHRMQMYCDGENIHLLITYASCFDNPGNGDDYNFYLDGEPVKFKVIYDDNGNNLTSQRAPGTYTLKILHQDRSGSSYEALGAHGTMTVHEGQLNNVTEISIPVSEMVRQNDNINPESFSLIEFFTPNLMYRRIATAGASSGPWPFALASVVFFTGVCCVSERKKIGYVRDTQSL